MKAVRVCKARDAQICYKQRRMKILAAVALLSLALNASAQTRPRDVPKDLDLSFERQFAPEGLITIAATGALFAFARPQDRRLRGAVTTPPLPISHDLASVGTYLGNGAVLFPMAAATYAAGRWAGSGAAQETGAMGFEALSLAGLETEVLKYAAQRRRPDGSDKYSFPSGHSSESFAVAAVLASQYGWQAGVPACLAAGFVGYTRLQNDKHWLSDVVAGAGLGLLSGRAVWRVHREEGRVAVLPWLAPGQAGALVSTRF